MSEINYQEAYEREHEKCADLADKIVVLESEKEDLQFKLDRIKKNKFWKATGPARSLIHFAQRQRDRLSHCGGPKDILRKIRNKSRQKSLMESYGTGSFPDAEQRKKEEETIFPYMPKISILVPLWNNKREFQIQMLDCVMNQTYPNWELCLADGSDAEHSYIEELCREYAAKANGRIVYKHLDHNGGISYNTNECYKLATGDYIGLFDQDDILHPSVLYAYVKEINEQGADYLYCDETTFKENDINKMLTMHFKPDYAPDNLRANNYICHFSVFSRKLLEGEELFRTAFDGAQDHDMILRLTDRAQKIVHVPRLMYYWRSHAGSTAASIDAKPYAIEAAKGAVADHLKKHGFKHFQITSTRACATIFRIRYQILGDPKISIVIANKDHMEDLKRCITSIQKNSTWSNYEIIVVENNSTTPEIRDYYSQLLGLSGNDSYAERCKLHTVCGHDGGILHSEDGRISVVTYHGDFNYSAVNNLGVSYATGDYILLLNNDTEVITANWMEEMLMYAQRRAVDDRVQPPHIFVVGGLDDGHVELLVRQGPVSARLCDALHPLRFLADLRQFFVCGTLTGQRHGGGLKDQPHFKQVPGPDPGPQVGQRRQIHRAGGQILRDKRALAPADLQHALGHQKGDGLPERGAADVQRLTEFVFIRELAPRRELPFVHD